MGFFEKLVAGLGKTRDNIVSGMDSIFHGFSRIDDDFYEELEEVLIMGDLGVQATYDILDDLKAKVKEKHIKEPMECRELLIESIKEQMDIGETAYEFENHTSVVMVIGVNGVGKTTTIGKLAGKLRAEDKKVVIAAADTFRAAAGEQLKEWANRSQAELIGGQEGSDPASVVFDAVAAAKARHADVLMIDTAGRLHNKKNLMEELRKMNKIIDREFPEAYRETLVVLDATTGQNALQQAKEFNDVAEITGIVLTKMDLADPKLTREWISYYEQNGHPAIAVNSNQGTLPAIEKKIKEALKEKIAAKEARGIKNSRIKAMCIGIPNVGKSTLLNRLVKKNVAIVGNKPGVTKAQQWLKAGSSLLLLDTPGILWPKFEDPIVGKKLALTGAVKDTLYAKDDVALYELEYFVDNHPQALTERYKLDESDLDQPTVELLLSITKKMGFKEDYDRASERLIFE